MNYKFIQFDIDSNVGLIKFNRPDVLNSFNLEMGKELHEALEKCDSKEIRCVVITGEGRAFCAGQDLAEAVPKDKPLAELGKILDENYNKTILLIRNLNKPVIAAVNGVAAGAGANIALACDIVIASEKASFAQVFSKIGLIPDSGGTYFLPRLIGFQKASALMMMGDKVSADEAEKLGMIYKVISENEFKEKVNEIAKQLATMPTKGFALTKKALNQSMNNDLESQLELEKQLQIEAGNTHDYKEGVQAFLEKRKPNFKGN
ncbi:MAG: 2-(1,2-epoxy-1,2-dihydrophenyl)acetyl-CoA isomerase PaaG [Melioribacteraceae bacterium]|jgi:2-(1,2-epoxy-1,2-dihydrophenyl)acetyl-CoA isomerase|nr:2-(1,2-epoxy-1,2-dihydrophenyl)acetyl-CoA isomerase PaaG [Melioribacteraceae bacterium]WKZ69794.1 MAG: 2-(1,2-epoxy-1,2-dihydrophenyl)acetyl-CoA isomerase PaaG [Melioribacteraceae bacterium]